jgi:hypothetical protein
MPRPMRHEKPEQRRTKRGVEGYVEHGMNLSPRVKNLLNRIYLISYNSVNGNLWRTKINVSDI